MREVVMRTRCDSCGAPDQIINNDGDVLGSNAIKTDFPVTVGRTGRIMDLCEECQNSILNDMQTWLGLGSPAPKNGQTGTSSRSEPKATRTYSKAPYHCPDCDFEAANPQGLGAHRRTKHNIEGTSLSTLRTRDQRKQQQKEKSAPAKKKIRKRASATQ